LLVRRSFLAATVAAISAGARTSVASKTGYAPVNGLKLYYEIHGAGRPLILLHGGLGATPETDREYRTPVSPFCRA
jgi:hypothetical protein